MKDGKKGGNVERCRRLQLVEHQTVLRYCFGGSCIILSCMLSRVHLDSSSPAREQSIIFFLSRRIEGWKHEGQYVGSDQVIRTL